MAGFKDFYVDELRFLTDAGKNFAKKFPEIGHSLNLNADIDKDPYVQRLFEGFGFVSARLKEQIENDFPELNVNLLEKEAPFFVRPMPSCSMLEFQYKAGMLQSTYKVERGTEVLSNPSNVSRFPYRFTTSKEVLMNPFKIKDIMLDERSSSFHAIEVKIELEDEIEWSDLQIGDLNFYIHGPDRVGWILHYYFNRYLKQVDIHAGSHSVSTPSIHFSGFEVEEALLPKRSLGKKSYYLLREFFAFNQKFKAFSINNFDPYVESCTEDEISLRFVFKRKFPDEIRKYIDKNILKLNVVPIRNIFERQIENIELDKNHYEYLLVGDKKENLDVFEVLEVKGKGKGADEVERFYDFFPHFNRVFLQYANRNSGFYYSFKKEDKKGGGNNTFLSIGKEGDVSYYQDETLYVRALCSHGIAPSENLKEGDVTNRAPGFPAYIAFKNLDNASPYLYPRKEPEYTWKSLQFMNGNLRSLLTSSGVLNMVYIFAADVKGNTRQMFELLTGAELNKKSYYQDTVFRQGYEVILNFQGQEFEKDEFLLSQLNLFGHVFQRILVDFLQKKYVLSLVINVPTINMSLVWEEKEGTCQQI